MQILLTIIWMLLALLVVTVTLLSLIPGRSWVLRVCDFPRAQMLTLGLILIAAAISAIAAGHDLAPDSWIITVTALSLILLVSVVIQGVWAVRLTSLVKPEVPKSGIKTPCFHKRHPELPDEHSLRLIIANVDYANSDRAAAIEYLLHWRPHVLALIETDAQWDEHIERCRSSLPHIVKELRGLGRGLSLLSRLPIKHADIECLVDDDRPSIWAQLRVPGSDGVGLVITHPSPPGLPKRHSFGRHSSAKRDIELDIIASRVGSHPGQHWVVSGDFNDVGWSATTMRAKHISGLRDPRVGRGMFSTFPASFPLLRYPIDHVLVSKSFRLVHLMRLDNIGSDHLPLLADLELPRTEESGSESGTQADQLIYSTCEKQTREVNLHRRDRSYAYQPRSGDPQS